MSNIVSLDGKRFASVLRITPDKVVHQLRALWVARIISTDAFFLGAMVMGDMQRNDLQEVCVSHTQAQRAFTGVKGTNGNVFTGPVDSNRLSFILALQDLQFKAGITNHFDKDRLNDVDAAQRHFTLDPTQPRDLWSDATPIYFRMPSQPAEEYNEAIAVLFQAGMKVCQHRVDIGL